MVKATSTVLSAERNSCPCTRTAWSLGACSGCPTTALFVASRDFFAKGPGCGHPVPPTTPWVPVRIGPDEADRSCVRDEEQTWYAPLMVFCLVSAALLAALAERRDLLQTVAAILAVLVGALIVLRGEFLPWFRSANTGLQRGVGVSVTMCGALVVGAGAAFLLT